ncbi:MAG TPA: polysaccharide deacetylase family protein [Selenomonadales bacterium]|nr:polysaccharide deacetylase family protein [Selenomonadales bacterium]
MRKLLRKYFAIGGLALLLGGGGLLAGVESGYITTGHEMAVRKIPTSHKVIALTFDDGPSTATTPQLLKVLHAKAAKATFFVLGTSIQKAPALLSAIAEGGHEVASHSFTHRFSNTVPKEELFQELDKTAALIAGVAARPTLFRPPGGGYNDNLVRELKQHGYTTVLWSVDPRDWERRSPAQISSFVIEKAAPGAIVLLHEGECAAGTPEAVAKIIDTLRSQGYEFVTVSELLQYYEVRD